MPKLQADANGIVTEGRFVGHHVDEVMEYLENLEGRVSSSPTAGDPPAGEPTPAPAPKAKPEEELVNRGKGRVDAMSQFLASTAQRQEQDDEEGFAATVADYETFRPKIAEMKKSLAPAARVQRGLHQQMYVWLKTQDPAVQAQLLGRPAPEPDEEEEPVAGSGPLGGVPPEASPVAAPKPVKPRAVPPPAAPRSGRTAPPPAPVTAPKLKANPKIERMAASAGMKVDEYLKQLEAQGMTQESIDSLAAPVTQTTRRKTIFDNAFE